LLSLRERDGDRGTDSLQVVLPVGRLSRRRDGVVLRRELAELPLERLRNPQRGVGGLSGVLVRELRREHDLGRILRAEASKPEPRGQRDHRKDRQIAGRAEDSRLVAEDLVVEIQQIVIAAVQNCDIAMEIRVVLERVLKGIRALGVPT
jgi:hypothetical protein